MIFETKNKKIEIRNNSSDDMLDDKILNIPTYPPNTTSHYHFPKTDLMQK